jgi:AraC-like DNA-binding protein
MGRKYQFLPGNVFVSTPSQAHRMRQNPKGLILQRILFSIPDDGESVLGFSASETEWLVRSLLHLPGRMFAASDKLKNAFASLFEIYDGERKSQFARRLKMKTAAANLLVAVVDDARRKPARTPGAICDIARRISENPRNGFNIRELAKETGLATAKFFEEFKRETGLPPHAYLLNCRIRCAQEMLKCGKQSIDAISDMLRFSSRQHFSTIFKRTVGIPPGQYRRNAAKLSSPI